MQSKTGSASETLPQMENRIINFFNEGRIVLLTGGSGFLGKVIVEKFLRLCPKIGKIYLIIRAKKGKSAQERLQVILNGDVSCFNYFYRAHHRMENNYRRGRGQLFKIDLYVGSLLEDIVNSRSKVSIHFL